MNFDWRAQFLWDETSTLRIITCDSEVTGERGPGLCLELLFFSLYRLLCSKLLVVPHLPQRKTQRKKKALMWPVGPQQDQASFSSHLSCHHSPLGHCAQTLLGHRHRAASGLWHLTLATWNPLSLPSSKCSLRGNVNGAIIFWIVNFLFIPSHHFLFCFSPWHLSPINIMFYSFILFCL